MQYLRIEERGALLVDDTHQNCVCESKLTSGYYLYLSLFNKDIFIIYALCILRYKLVYYISNRVNNTFISFAVHTVDRARVFVCGS